MTVFHFAVLVFVASALVTAEKCCPSGWITFGSRCFMFFNDEKTWSDAEKTCISHGGNLASVHSLSENNFLGNLIERVTGVRKRTWTGGSDAIKEGVWLWSDGSKFDYVNFRANQPDNHRRVEHCLEVTFNDNYWNDHTCNTRKSFVCAKNPHHVL